MTNWEDAPDKKAGATQWEDAPDPEASARKNTTAAGLAGAATRGAGPYAAGAMIGGLAGAPLAGIGAVPGAAAGVGAVSIYDAATGLVVNPIAQAGKRHGLWNYDGMPSASQVMDPLWDKLGVERPQTGVERVVEAGAGGVGGAVGGLKAAETVAGALEENAGPTVKRILDSLQAGPKSQIASGALGGVGSQTAAEAGAGPVGQAVAGLAGGALPGVPGTARTLVAKANLPSTPRGENYRDLAEKGVSLGYTIPSKAVPENKSSAVTGALETVSGRQSTVPHVAEANQQNTNAMAGRALRLPPGTMLTDEVFNRLLREEGAHYDAVRKSVPTILRDAKYDAAFAEIKAVEDLREKNFPGLTDNAPVSKLVSSMTTVPEFDTATAMKTVQDLRHNSKINLSATGDKAAATHELGLKQWNAAQELDGLIARNVEDAPNYLAKKAAAASKDVDSLTKKLAKVQQTAGLEQKKAAGMLGTDDEASVRALAEQRVLQQQLAQAQAVKTAAEEQLAQQPTGKRAVDHVISNYLSAREQFAKIYNVWDVTNTSTGEVNARGLAKLLGNDVPLSGELKDIADMARAFPKYFKTPQETGGVESYGVLDAAAASKGGLMALLAGLRYPMRKLVTSKGYQEEMYARDRDWVKHLPGAGQAGAAGNVANRIESDKDPTP